MLSLFQNFFFAFSFARYAHAILLVPKSNDEDNVLNLSGQHRQQLRRRQDKQLSSTTLFSTSSSTVPSKKCLYIEIGAHDGSAYDDWVHGQGDYRKQIWDLGFPDVVKQGELNPAYPTYYAHRIHCEAILIEENPDYIPALNSLMAQQPSPLEEIPQNVHLLTRSVANFQSCNKTQEAHYGAETELVDVPSLLKNIDKNDQVLLKIDVQGSQSNIIPCLAQSPKMLDLVDKIFVVEHPSRTEMADPLWWKSKVDPLKKFEDMGVQINFDVIPDVLRK